MPAGARPAGGPNPKRPAARRRRSADGASRAAPGRPPQDRARAAHAHSLASIATLCGGIGTVGALWILLALLGFLPTVGGTNPVRFESDSILGMRIQSRSDFPTARQYLAYQRDTYTRVTGRDLDLQLEGRTTSTSLFKTMQETLDLARTNVASGVTADDLKLKEDLHGWNNLNEVYRAAKYESIYGTALEDDVGRAYDAGLERAIQNGTEVKPRSKYREEHLRNMRKKIVADRKKNAGKKTAGDVCASHGGLYVPSFRASAACEISQLDQRSSHTSRTCSREPRHTAHRADTGASHLYVDVQRAAQALSSGGEY